MNEPVRGQCVEVEKFLGRNRLLVLEDEGLFSRSPNWGTVRSWAGAGSIFRKACFHKEVEGKFSTVYPELTFQRAVEK